MVVSSTDDTTAQPRPQSVFRINFYVEVIDCRRERHNTQLHDNDIGVQWQKQNNSRQNECFEQTLNGVKRKSSPWTGNQTIVMHLMHVTIDLGVVHEPMQPIVIRFVNKDGNT